MDPVIRINDASIRRAAPGMGIAGASTHAALPAIDADGRDEIIVLDRTGAPMGRGSTR